MNHQPVLAFGDDGTAAADVAWLAINSHSWPEWRLLIITAHVPPVGPPLPREETELHPWDPPHPRRSFAEAEFVAVENLTASTDPRLALSLDCDLVVIGPRGLGLLKALHLGSTADWLLQHPPAPLLIARHGRRTNDVVVCTDNSPHAHRAMASLVAMPWAKDLNVVVVVVDDGRVDVDAATRAASTMLQPAAATLDTRVLIGEPTPSIHDYLQQRAPDLVVLGTRGLTGLQHLRVGSTASGIARTALCSVLIACADE